MYHKRLKLQNEAIFPSSIKHYQFSYQFNRYFSMTTLLTHTVAHSTKPSFSLKANNQPIKKLLSCAVSCQKWQNSDYQSQSQFFMSKIF